MRGEDFTTALQTLGLDTQAAAKWLGVSVRAVQRYRVSGAPKMAERLLRVGKALERQTDNMAFVLNHANVGTWYDKCSQELAEDRLALDWRE